jgi:hypothetical protein
MKRAPVALALLLAFTAPAALAQLHLNFSLPGARIGLNLGGYPALQPIPGYPVYYAPGVGSNYFFYDGYYWVFQDDNWYASSWYNGPWALVDPFDVPPYLLRVPVRYYRHPPAYFRGWRAAEAPHWGEHWGPQWSERRRGWERWDRDHRGERAAPLPTYQRDYRGNRYPHDVREQAQLHERNYRYTPPQSREQRQEGRTQQREMSKPAPQGTDAAGRPAPQWRPDFKPNNTQNDRG